MPWYARFALRREKCQNFMNEIAQKGIWVLKLRFVHGHFAYKSASSLAVSPGDLGAEFLL